MSEPTTIKDHKSHLRDQVWTTLRQVALPDSRFHTDFTSFIPDFSGSSAATTRLCSLPIYQRSPIIFIAPDNCLEELRHRALQDGKVILVTTYGIRRGFWVLDPQVIAREDWRYASTLDGMEKVGRRVGFREMKLLAVLERTQGKIPMMVTGTGAISKVNGLRFGKGHGYFDLEWAMLYQSGLVTKETKTVSVCHACQVVDLELVGEIWDTGCDFLVTNEEVLTVEGAAKPECGILFDSLEKGMLEEIPSLKELRDA
ncbi:5-formyltetrahydrofolate cyclo-ligase [Coleophoma cylindrospora]|uniref:5-formyltetrahydrofolate cyclo-ligase n=1 Tax=Coleophoma cylindrospora TaxID=1849047 RepID=A0A3D8RZR7_9HELO|nr:5-formyltetrahydrofolate cyclo-ligase [Coleophoma cylindrospora]